jgi:hypothetical protein
MDPVTSEQLAALREEMRGEMQKMRTEMEGRIETLQSQNKTLRIQVLRLRYSGESIPRIPSRASRDAVTRIAWGLWIADSGDLYSGDLGDFQEACRMGDLKAMKKAVEKEPDLLHIKDDEGDTPLMSAVKSGESPVKKIRWLLDHGADPNVTDDENNTPLVYASEAGDTSVVKLLLEKGADPTIGGPLKVAANEECKQALKVSLLPLLGVPVHSGTDRGVLSLA